MDKKENEQKIREYIENALNALPDDWISVEDMLPSKSGLYLIVWHDKVFQAHFDVYDKAWDTEEANDLSVTHWMPLPKPPQSIQ